MQINRQLGTKVVRSIELPWGASREVSLERLEDEAVVLQAVQRADSFAREALRFNGDSSVDLDSSPTRAFVALEDYNSATTDTPELDPANQRPESLTFLRQDSKGRPIKEIEAVWDEGNIVSLLSRKLNEFGDGRQVEILTNDNGTLSYIESEVFAQE